jgi:hypothetical protein
MAITRTPLVDDDGSGNTGSIINNALKTELYDQIDAADAAVAAAAAADIAATVDPGICAGRLTLTSGTPVTTADVTGATTIYWTPYTGNRLALYASGAWSVLTFTEIPLALGTMTSGLPYDVFAFNNSGAVALEKLAWTNGTTRATALALQDGVLVKSGDATRRYLGTFYTTSTTATEDSVAKRYCWNYYHRERRPLVRRETTANWTYTTATWRQANGAAANQVEAIIGVAEVTVDLFVFGTAHNSSAGVGFSVGIGVNSTSTYSSSAIGGYVESQGTSDNALCTAAHLALKPAIGLNTFAWLEISTATGTTTWLGTLFSGQANGLNGWIEG